MLTALLRTASVLALLCGTACQFGSTPNVGQSSGNNARKKDAGADAETRRVTTASGDVRSRDAQVETDADARADGQARGGAGGKSGDSKSSGGADADKDHSEPSEDDKRDEQDDQDDDSKSGDQDTQEPEPNEQEPTAAADAGTTPADAGPQLPPIDAAVDAGPRPMVDNPFGVLGDLAQRTAGGKTAATINKFLETLAQGEAPAMSIREFLLAVDEEMDCVMNPFATECLAACQAVSTTCAVCVFDEMCRTTMLEICGYSALAGCVPRR